MKRFFGFLVEEDYLEKDPSQRIPRPKLPRALTILQVQAFFKAMQGGDPLTRRESMFFRLMYACGLRMGEVVKVGAEDIDFEEGWLQVVGKGNKERRIYLKPYMLEALREHIEENQQDGYLFPGADPGRPINGSHMGRRLNRYVQEAGLPPEVSAHTLRHSIAVHHLTDGATISFVQGFLGHASLATTGIYSRLADEMTREIGLGTPTAVEGIEEQLLKEEVTGYQVGLEGFLGRLFG